MVRLCFFAKNLANYNILNDSNELLVSFYQVAAHPRLSKMFLNRVAASCYSRAEYKRALSIFKNPQSYNKITKAWALWYLSKTCFGGNLGAGFVTTPLSDNEARNRAVQKFLNSKNQLSFCCEKLNYCIIEQADALDIIKKYDGKNTFFYVDPPYISTNQGHYAGYTEADYIKLLKLLDSIKGSFLLSGYFNDLVSKSWECFQFKTKMVVNNTGRQKESERIECVWRKRNGAIIQTGLFAQGFN